MDNQNTEIYHQEAPIIEQIQGIPTITQPDLKAEGTTASEIFGNLVDGQKTTEPVVDEPISPPVAVKIDDLELTHDQIKEYKAQAELIPQLKQRAEIADQITQLWEQGPEGQKRVIEALQELAGVSQPVSSTQQQTVDTNGFPVEDLSDEGKYLFEENKKLKEELKAVNEYVNSQIKTQKIAQVDHQTNQAIQSLKDSFNVEVSKEDLYQAVNQTGITDLEAAWLKVNKAKLTQPAVTPPAQVIKPVSPTGTTGVFSTKGMSASQILRHLDSGLSPAENN